MSQWPDCGSGQISFPVNKWGKLKGYPSLIYGPHNFGPGPPWGELQGGPRFMTPHLSKSTFGSADQICHLTKKKFVLKVTFWEVLGDGKNFFLKILKIFDFGPKMCVLGPNFKKF